MEDGTWNHCGMLNIIHYGRDYYNFNSNIVKENKDLKNSRKTKQDKDD